MHNILTVQNITYDYPGKRALDDVSFTVPQGSITALVGPNGAGKSTLMRCLAALDRPLRGHITLDETDVLERPRECHRKVGYLSDFFGLYRDLTVYQCLLFVAASHKVPSPKDAVEQTISALKLEPYAAKLAGTLSRGWQQRLGIAQAIIHRPKILMLDEPASGLDPEARSELASLLTTLQKSGVTIMVSSHILSELNEYSTHMLVLKDGCVQDFRPIDDHAAPSVELSIHIAQPHPQFTTLLANVEAFSLSTINDLNARGTFKGSQTQLAELLQTLVRAKLPVCRFEIIEKDMQDVYLDIIRSPSMDEGEKESENV